jgi:protein-S-isoprenylcysteine O-methyltransferase Ste14
MECLAALPCRVTRCDMGDYRMRNDADSPGVIIFPPLLFLSTLILGLLLHFLIPLPWVLPALASRVIGVLFLLGSLVLARSAEGEMKRVGTNIRPNEPTTFIVTGGPFRYSRNPLYIASLGLYIGLALLFPAVWPLLLIIPMVIVLSWGVVAREERYLDAKFGAEYRVYRERVRRWI